ncbi:MAG: hypothetical protein J6A83_09030 [Clostridia bacterium]|nr:hypothetical protein [Clostridia bacterium]
MNTIKRIVAVLLLVSTLVLALASCNGGDEGIKNNGLLDESLFDAGRYSTFNRTVGAYINHDSVGKQSWGTVKNDLAEGRKVATFSFYFKRAVVDKTITKVKFTIEADRNVSVCFAGSRIGVNDALTTVLKTVSLNAGEKTDVVLEPNYFVDIKYPTFNVGIYPDDTRNYRALSDADYLEWNQTVYKITNIELYAE